MKLGKLIKSVSDRFETWHLPMRIKSPYSDDSIIITDCGDIYSERTEKPFVFNLAHFDDNNWYIYSHIDCYMNDNDFDVVFINDNNISPSEYHREKHLLSKFLFK